MEKFEVYEPNFADKMINYRAKNDLTQLQLAEKAKVDRTTICKAENGLNVSRLTRAKISLVIEGDENERNGEN